MEVRKAGRVHISASGGITNAVEPGGIAWEIRISLQLSLQNIPGNFDVTSGRMCFPVLGPQVEAGSGRKVARLADVEYALSINY